MALTGAMSAGISGLKAHMDALNVVGNNVANVNTQGYKPGRVTFMESIYSTQSAGSAGTATVGGTNPRQTGYGVGIGTIDLDMSSQSLDSTGRGMDCAIQGDGFFLVGDKTHDMLSVQQMDFINQVLGRMMNRTVCEYGQLSELDRSALVEVGNIMISTFVNALSGLAGVTIQPSVPGFAVDMQGAIITVPMAEFGGQSDYIMTIGTNFICEKYSVPCRLLLSPDVRSLNFLLRKLGVLDE